MCRKQIKNDLPQLKEILEQIIDEFDKCYNSLYSSTHRKHGHSFIGFKS